MPCPRCVHVAASRMESTGIAGEVQLSADTFERIKDRFVCHVRGKIAVKGKVSGLGGLGGGEL